MNKKVFGVVVLVGALCLISVGCAKNKPVSPTSTTKVETGTIQNNAANEAKNEVKADVFGSAKDITESNALASELKSVFSGVCGAAKLTILNYNFPTEGTDMMVYVWKNKPTEEKLKNAFEKNEYKIEESGNGITNLTKGNLYLTIDWGTPDREEGQEIVVLTAKQE